MTTRSSRPQFAVASVTLRGYWAPCRMAGAQARRVLINAAAENLGVPAAELTTEPSAVVHAASGRKLSYGEIAGFAKVPEKLPEIKPEELKPVAQFRLIGKDVPRFDVPDKVTGKPLYAIDAQVPGMLYGTIVRPPYKGSGPKSFNRDEIKKQPGIVEAVAFEHAIGIVGESVMAVFNARQKVKAEWREAAGAKVNSVADLQRYLADVRRSCQERRGRRARPVTPMPRSRAPRASTPATSPTTTSTTRSWSRIPAPPGSRRTASRSGPARNGRRNR